MIWLLIACESGPNTEVLPTEGIPEGQAEDDFGPAPEFSLTNQNGETRTKTSFAGRVWVADFIFTSCPTVCPLLTTRMAEAQKAWPWAQYVSFSVDPGTDSPPVLLAYAQRFGAGPGWDFLTGEVGLVKSVVVEGFKQTLEVVGQGQEQTILHGERFVVIDKAGRMRGFPEAGSPELAELMGRVK